MAKTAYQVAGQIFYQTDGAMHVLLESGTISTGVVTVTAGTVNIAGTVPINRGYKTVSLTIGSAAAVTEELDMTGYAGGLVHLAGTTWTDANIGFQVAPTTGGTYAILRDYLGAPVQISGVGTAVSRAYQIPDEVFAAGYVKLWSKSTTEATETDTNQGDARSLTVILKG